MILLYTPDPSASSEPPDEVGNGIYWRLCHILLYNDPIKYVSNWIMFLGLWSGFSISWVRGCNPVLDISDLATESSQSLGMLLDQLRVPHVQSLSNSIIIVLVNWLVDPTCFVFLFWLMYWSFKYISYFSFHSNSDGDSVQVSLWTFVSLVANLRIRNICMLNPSGFAVDEILFQSQSIVYNFINLCNSNVSALLWTCITGIFVILIIFSRIKYFMRKLFNYD